MKAMIFAAGLGTRLRPITDTIPKALVEVNGKPLLWHTIERLKRAGYNEIIINIHHFGNQIIEYVEANDSFGIRVEFSDERDALLNTGGGIKHAGWFFDDGEPFLIHNVDIFTNIDLQKFRNDFIESNAMVSMVVSERDTARYLLFDDEQLLRGWTNKKTGDIKSPVSNFDPSNYTEYAFSGIHMLSPDILKCMNSYPDSFSIIDFYIAMSSDIAIRGWVPNQLQMIDVGKHESLALAETFLKELD